MQIYAPIVVSWEITSRCNLSCRHCYAYSEQKGDLTKRVILRIANELSSLRVLQIVFGGGEPFLRKDFMEILSYVRRNTGIRCCVASNGTVVDSDLASRLGHMGIAVQISIDGATDDTHDSFRGSPGSFRKALRGTRYLLENDVSVTLCTTVSKLNQNELPQLLDLAANLGVKGIRFRFLFRVGRAKDNWPEIALPFDRWNTLAKMLKKKKETYAGRIRVEYENFNIHARYRTVKRFTPARLFCNAGTIQAVITSRGDVLACSFLRERQFVAGNLQETGFEKIWFESDTFRLFRDITSSSLNDKCGKCFYLEHCNQCRALSYLSKGDLLGQDPRCKF